MFLKLKKQISIEKKLRILNSTFISDKPNPKPNVETAIEYSVQLLTWTNKSLNQLLFLHKDSITQKVGLEHTVIGSVMDR